MENDSSSKTVYFLGAGASAASEFKLPTMEKFFREWDFEKRDYRNLKKFLTEYFSSRKPSELNLEEVITCLELSLDSVGSFGKDIETYKIDAKQECFKYIKERLTYSPDTQKKVNYSERYKIIFERLDKRDTIITLNYDLIIDYTLQNISSFLTGKKNAILSSTPLLWGRGEKIYYTPWDEKGDGQFLKLHGTINWLYCENPKCRYHQVIYEASSQELVSILAEEINFCRICGSLLSLVIIPPTLHKSFEKFPKLGFIWALARRELIKADRIIMIGISLADSDYYLKWLIRSAIALSPRKIVNGKEVPGKQIEVINKWKKEDEKEAFKGGEVCWKIERLTGISPVYQGDLDDYLEKIKLGGL